MAKIQIAMSLLLSGLLAACGHGVPVATPNAGGAIAAQSRSVKVEGRKVAFREAGKGPTVVLIHGFPLDHRMWDAQVAALSAHHHVIAPDLAGFGGSDARPGTTATMEDDAADVNALLTQLKCPGAVVVGFSMGGYVALAYQHAYPAEVQGLALLGTDADAADPNSDDTKGLLDLANQVAAQGPAPAIDAMAPIMLAADNHDPAMAAKVRTLMEPGNARGIEGALRGMAVRHGAKPWLAGIKTPTLVAAGTADQVIPPAASDAIAAAIPNARRVALQGAGHLMPLERATELNTLLASWLDARR